MPSVHAVDDSGSLEVEDLINFQQGDIWFTVAFGELVLVFMKSRVGVDGPFNKKAELQDLVANFSGHVHEAGHFGLIVCCEASADAKQSKSGKLPKTSIKLCCVKNNLGIKVCR